MQNLLFSKVGPIFISSQLPIFNGSQVHFKVSSYIHKGSLHNIFHPQISVILQFMAENFKILVLFHLQVAVRPNYSVAVPPELVVNKLDKRGSIVLETQRES